MKDWQFYSLQGNIMIAIAFSANSPGVKIAFAALAVFYMIVAWVTLSHD